MLNLHLVDHQHLVVPTPVSAFLFKFKTIFLNKFDEKVKINITVKTFYAYFSSEQALFENRTQPTQCGGESLSILI